mmetsp:Transcript_25043/g.70044  ORF Transcript_25043/g.70044 Transcript_25043/m.70044 type:complete len:230 (+) Transcript_25043:388-1077(+)
MLVHHLGKELVHVLVASAYSLSAGVLPDRPSIIATDNLWELEIERHDFPVVTFTPKIAHHHLHLLVRGAVHVAQPVVLAQLFARDEDLHGVLPVPEEVIAQPRRALLEPDQVEGPSHQVRDHSVLEAGLAVGRESALLLRRTNGVGLIGAGLVPRRVAWCRVLINIIVDESRLLEVPRVEVVFLVRILAASHQLVGAEPGPALGRWGRPDAEPQGRAAHPQGDGTHQHG